MAYVPNSGSVVAFQSDPTKLVGTVSVVGTLPVVLNNSSIIAVQQGSIATVIIGGSIAASFTPPDNQSVSGTVGASVIGHAPVVIVGGSILTSSTPNQSISGTVQTDVRGSVATVIIGGSIAASFTPPENQSVSGTVQTEQTGAWRVSVLNSIPSSLLAGVSVIGLTPVNVTNFPTSQNVSGSVVARNIIPSSLLVGASIIGLPPVNVTNFPTNQNVSGSVVAFQGGAPWAVNNGGSIITVGQGSIAVNIIAGSVAVAVTPVDNQSVSGTVGASVIGTVPVTQVTNPWVITGSVQGVFSVASIVPVLITESTNASIITVGTPAANQSVSGTVGASLIGTAPVTQSNGWRVSVISSNPSSLLAGVSVIGLTPINVTNFPTSQNVSGSVVAFQATTWPGSVASHIKSGSVIAVLGGNTSVVVANFPTSQNVSGSVVAFQGTNPWAVTNVGSIITTNIGSVVVLARPNTASSIQGVAVLTSTSVTTMVAAGGAGVSNHITDIWLANTGAATTLVTFSAQGGASILGYTIVPAGGGSNLPGLSMPITTPANQTFNIQAATATSTLYATVKGYRV